jgi:AcrR family transcriptional regulator
MPRDSSATKARLLEAAFAEFAAFGLAGARVDRIAAGAAANKRLIYVYFGSKEQLFETVVDLALREIIDTVPFTPTDLSGYAGSLFDHLVAHPRLVRLSTWKLLERPGVAAGEVAAYRAKAEAISAAQAEGDIGTPLAPVDLLILVLALVTGWFTTSPALLSLGGPDPTSPQRLAAHRSSVVTAVGALVGDGRVFA